MTGNGKAVGYIVAALTGIATIVSVGVWAGSTGSDLENHVERAAHPQAAERLRTVEGKVQVLEADLKHLKDGQKEIKDGQQRIEDLLRPGVERPR